MKKRVRFLTLFFAESASGSVQEAKSLLAHSHIFCRIEWMKMVHPFQERVNWQATASVQYN